MLDVLKRMRDALRSKNEAMNRPMTDTGGEIHDGTPVAPPLGFRASLSVEERIIQAMRLERMAVLAEQQGRETIVEFNDFGSDDDDDEPMPVSRFEGPVLDAKRMGRDYRLSKAERERQDAAMDRFARKIGEHVRSENEDFVEEDPLPTSPRRRSPSSGARRRVAPEGRQDGRQTPSGNDEPE